MNLCPAQRASRHKNTHVVWSWQRSLGGVGEELGGRKSSSASWTDMPLAQAGQICHEVAHLMGWDGRARGGRMGELVH